jgi:hypothetical protein
MSKRGLRASVDGGGGATKKQCGDDGKAVPTTNKAKLLALLSTVTLRDGLAALIYGMFLGPEETTVYEPTWAIHTGVANSQFAQYGCVTKSWQDLQQNPCAIVQQPTPHLTCDFHGHGACVVVDSGPIDVELTRAGYGEDTWIHIHDQSGRGIVIFPPGYTLNHEPPDSDFGGYVICGYNTPRTFGVRYWNILLTIQCGRLKRIAVTFDLSVPLVRPPRPAAAAAAATK